MQPPAARPQPPRPLQRPIDHGAFLHRPADLRLGDLAGHPAVGLHRPARLADRTISRGRPAFAGDQRGLSRRRCRDARTERHAGDRTAAQRRRGFPLHGLLEPFERHCFDHADLRSGHRHRYRADRGAEPAEHGRGPAARRSPPPGHHRASGERGLPDDRRADVGIGHTRLDRSRQYRLDAGDR